MGLWTWTINQMLTPKFFKHLKHYGLLNTYRRGHKQSRFAHYQGGHRTDSYVKRKGQDQFGNVYYEDFDVYHRNHRRWVEYTDHFMSYWASGDRVPAGYHGWLAHVYDDFPAEYGPTNFQRKEYQFNLSYSPLFYSPQGYSNNVNKERFMLTQKNRSRQVWDAPQEEEQKVFIGKKLVANKPQRFDDAFQSE